METPRAVPAMIPQEARIADVAGCVLPDPRQGDARLRREALDDGLEYALEIAFGRHCDREAQ